MNRKKTKEKRLISRKAAPQKKVAKETQNSAGKAARASKKAATDRSKLFYVLHLFVVGMSPKSQDAIANVRGFCEKYLKGRHLFEVIDINQHPLAASENQIIAVPTLIKKLPPPLRKFLGDMTNLDKMLARLDLRSEAG
jgi:circadian clock protein KaiB